jgi:hypothetical protein
MAEQTVHDVDHLKESVGTNMPIDDIAQTTLVSAAGNGQAHTQLDPTEGLPNDRAHADGEIQEQHGLAASKYAIPDIAAHLDVDADAKIGETIERPASAADASGGSDTDTSRTDVADSALGAGMGHTRSNSVKKPTTFKSVSVTKSFLAKSAVAAPNVRPGEKGKDATEHSVWSDADKVQDRQRDRTRRRSRQQSLD